MSTDRKRLTSAIQKIAREDPQIRGLLDEFRNSGGKPSTSSTSGAGAEDRQICCDGSRGESVNPGSSTRDPGDGGQDASGGLGDDPAKIESGPGSLTGVKDCSTGEPVCFQGADWIPPDGWSDAQTPPVDPTWQKGYGWENQHGVWDSPLTVGCWGPDCCLNCEGDIYVDGTDTSGVPTAYKKTAQCNTAPGVGCDGSARVTRVEDAGNIEPPLAESHWPEDGCINLAIKRGKLVASKYDPEAQGTSYLKGVDSIELCDDYGNSFSLAPAANGGWKTINSTTNNGYLYDSSGKQIAHIDGNEYSDPSV